MRAIEVLRGVERKPRVADLQKPDTYRNLKVGHPVRED
jgi:hypothetical protein